MTSVIIPTYQGEDKISKCIESLLNQSSTGFEIIIAIDGSTDKTEDIARQKLKDYPNYKIISQENKGRAAIRNFGAQSATGNVLVFYDDDTRASVDSVYSHTKFHDEQKGAVFQGSIITDHTKIDTDIQLYKAQLEKKWELSLISDSGVIDGAYLSAANFSITKELFNHLGGFDDSLSDCEDFELSTRLQESSFPVFYDSANFVFHDDPITLVKYINRKRDYALAQKDLIKNDPVKFEKYNQRNFVPRKGLKKIIYKCLSSKKLVEIIDREHFLIMALPKKLRFKLYELTIQSLSQYFPNKIIN
ncbi:MAG: glycosyltransferase involved in cell wall biosynthesis [Patiriisocius sp.]|jgi:glycosyltransferase involved in cell wall biosynthesis